jgi:hypothetical protein
MQTVNGEHLLHRLKKLGPGHGTWGVGAPWLARLFTAFARMGWWFGA